jgi:hypothetical protein
MAVTVMQKMELFTQTEVKYSLTFCEGKEENGNFQLILTVHILSLANGKLIEHFDQTNKEPGRM